MAINLKRRKRPSTTLQMAPMIDCVFQLLIFFMVTSILRVPPPFQVILPESDTRHDFPQKKYNVNISADGIISVDEKVMPNLDELELFLSAHENEIDTLIIKADRQAKHGVVIDVMERAKRRFSKPEGLEIALAVADE